MRLCISDKFPNYAGAAGPGAAREKHWLEERLSPRECFRKFRHIRRIVLINIRTAYHTPQFLPSSGSPDDQQRMGEGQGRFLSLDCPLLGRA